MNAGILTASFGTSCAEAERLSLDAIQKEIEEKFTGYGMYTAYTSKIVRDKIYAGKKIRIKDVKGALTQMAGDGVKNAYIQPTYIIPGAEYDKMAEEAGACKGMFSSLRIGKPLLGDDGDFEDVAEILSKRHDLNSCSKKKAAVLMGHGSSHSANECYFRFQRVLYEKGLTNVFVATVESKPRFDDILDEMKAGRVREVTLIPLLAAAGRHVRDDMAGMGEASWKSRLLSMGYNVSCVMEGLGEIEEIRNIYIRHLNEILRDERTP